MSRILLLLENRENARLLQEMLGPRHEFSSIAAEDQTYDLCITDALSLRNCAEFLLARKQDEDPVFFPVLLVTGRQNMALFTGPLFKAIDEVVLSPVEKLELFARVEMLLRARRLSLELRLQKDDLEAFIHAMTHDLRAPLRTVSGFAEAMAEDQSSRLDAAGRHQLDRIQAAVRQMWELIESLAEFSRIGRKAIKLRLVDLEEVVTQCLEQMRAEIQSRAASVHVAGGLGKAQADPALLKIAVCNLVSNGIKYTAPETAPAVDIEARVKENRVDLLIHDNGIGIPAGDQQRIFTPFVRLHGVEDYPGVGLGLAAARKVIEIMGGQLGVESQPGHGSTFCIELKTGGEE